VYVRTIHCPAICTKISNRRRVVAVVLRIPVCILTFSGLFSGHHDPSLASIAIIWPLLLASGASIYICTVAAAQRVWCLYLLTDRFLCVCRFCRHIYRDIPSHISFLHTHIFMYVIIPERAAVSPARPGAKKRRSERKFPFDKQAFLPRTSSLLFRSFSTNHLGTISLAIRLLYFLAQAITLASYEQRILNQSYRPPAFLVSSALLHHSFWPGVITVARYIYRCI
jgi:hypothetical protein